MIAANKIENVWRLLESMLAQIGSGHFQEDILSEAIERGKKLEQLNRMCKQLKFARQKGHEVSFLTKIVEELSMELDE